MKQRQFFIALLVILAGAAMYWPIQWANRKTRADRLDDGLSRENPAPSSPSSTETMRSVAGQGASGAPSNVTSVRSKANSLQEYLKTLDPKSEWIIDHDRSGRAVAISGGIIPEAGRSQESSDSFVRELIPFWNVDADDVHRSQVTVASSDLSHSFSYDQTKDGYEVYDGRMTVFARNGDGSVYQVNSELKDVGHPNLQIVLNSQEASAKALTYFNDRQPSVHSVKNQPVIYAIRPGESELGWVVFVDVKKPRYSGYEVVISARSGEKLSERQSVYE